MFHRFVLVAAVVVACLACGGGASHPHADAAVDAFASSCGFPGDLGNELGIGRFCMDLEDCLPVVSTAPLCSIAGDPTTHFCTKTCSATGSADQCGTNTGCQCNDPPNQDECGCTPNVCTD